MLNHRRGRTLLVLAGVSAALILVSLPALDGPLVLDSAKLFSLRGLVDEHGPFAIFHTPGFSREFDRIVSMASFVLNIQIHGGVSAYQIKLTNLGIHIATGVMIFVLTRMLLNQTPHGERAVLIALGASLMWLLSPVNFNVSMYAIQRMAQLSAFFTFAGLVCYTAGRLQDRILPRWLLLSAAPLLCLPMGILSKPNAALLVPLAFLVEVYFLHPVRPWFTGRQLAAAAVVGTLIGAGLLVFLYPGVLNYQNRDFTLAERLLSQPRALLDYLQHILLPRGSDTGIYTDDFTASRSPFSPWSTIPSIIACIALLVFCFLPRVGRLRLVAFGVAFFLVGHALESTFVSLELYFLHRNYLPDYGIYFALAFSAGLAVSRHKWLVPALVAYLAYFTALDYARSLTWSSWESIVSAAAHYHPDSPRAQANYAQLAVGQGELDIAATAIQRAIQLQGTLNIRVQQLYIRCLSGAAISGSQYRDLAAIRGFGRVYELSQALSNLLGLYERGGCRQLDVTSLVRVLDQLAERYGAQGGVPWTISYYADSFLYASGSRDAAHRRLQQRLDAGVLQAGLFHLELLIREQRHEQAARILEQISSQFDSSQIKRYESAIQSFRRQIRE